MLKNVQLLTVKIKFWYICTFEITCLSALMCAIYNSVRINCSLRNRRWSKMKRELEGRARKEDNAFLARLFSRARP